MKEVERVIKAAQVATRLLPDLIEWVKAMLEVGNSEEDIRRDIRSRRDEIRKDFDEAAEALKRKHGRE